MVKKASNDTLLRQWAMLRLLPSRSPGITATELTGKLVDQGYDVDVRTIQRDLNKLSGPFPFTCNDKSIPQGWHWIQNAALNIPGMSASEALTLMMVEDYLKPLLPASILEVLKPHLDQAARTLQAMDDDNVAARWRDKIRVVHPTLALLAPKVESDVLAVVQDGLLHDRQLEIEYQSFGADSPTTLRIHPLAMVQRGSASYLAATAFDYDDVRLYVVHRILAATKLDDEADRPKAFDIDAYIATGALQFGTGEPIHLVLRVNKSINRILAESPLSPDMQSTSEGDRFRITATIPSTWQLRWWLLSHASEVQVLAPETLRESVISSLSEAMALHNEQTSAVDT